MDLRRDDDEASKDPGADKAVLSLDQDDIEGHRAHSVFVGVHVPGERKHSHRKHRHHRRDSMSSQDANRPSTPPSQRVQFILGEDVSDEKHESHPLFSELEELVVEAGGDMEWKETARWIKFEENVEEGGNRWSKPHVGTLSLHSLFELRSLILNGTVLLDLEATSMEQIADLVLENMVNKGNLNVENRDKVKEALLKRHRHQHQRKNHVLPIIRSFAEMRNHSTSKNQGCNLYCYKPQRRGSARKGKTTSESNDLIAVDDHAFTGGESAHDKFLTVPGQGSEKQPRIMKSASNISMSRNCSSSDLGSINGDVQHNLHFMRKIPPGAEASNILVGEVDFLDKTVAAFIRLNSAATLGDLTEVPVPTRFLFVLLAPSSALTGYHEIGRAMATLMSDEIFHELAYRARNTSHLLAGIDEFLDAVTVLPPGEWDPAIRIEPPAAVPSQDVRKKPPEKLPIEDEEEDEERAREEMGLARSGVLFGGLINDIKRKVPWYWTDFKDALAMQSIASWIFLYFACLSPIITFGGLLSEATGKNMAAMESLVAGFVCGIGYGFFSGQPLTILGSTGPVLVFETIVYDFCLTIGWDYLSFRFWIGTWIAVILLLLVAIDASALVCYITRFTEENFATLIAFIFIYKAVENVLAIGKKFPINTTGSSILDYNCSCIANETVQVMFPEEAVNWNSLNRTTCLAFNGTLEGSGCSTPDYIPNVFLMSLILFFGTFLMSIHLKDFKNALFFPSKVRQFVSDFSVIIAILSMTVLDFKVGIPTPKLDVPDQFKPTLSDRGWIIPPFNGNPFYSIFLAIPPALLGTILIFMDQQITAVIVNRKEHKLKKSCGYHLDLFVLSILIEVCSFMGLPWFVAATVLSINHVNSLKLESECSAPGEKPQFLGVREQRVTHVLIFLTIGLSVFLTPVLGHIPMPVLFGVFLYMGISSLKGLQFFDRILIMFMPNKYQPDYMFLRQVPIKRVHLFTIIQLACLACLWTIKSFSSTSILFPLMLVVMIGIRKALDLIFTRRELKILDDIMPEMTKRHQMLKDNEVDPEKNPNEGHLKIPLLNGNVMNIPLTAINISEEVNKTGIWKQVNKKNTNEKPKEQKKKSPIGSGRFKKKKQQKKEQEKRENEKGKLEKRLSTMNEEEEVDEGITIKCEYYKDMPKKERRKSIKHDSDETHV